MAFRLASFHALIPVFLALPSLRVIAATVPDPYMNGFVDANSFPGPCCTHITGTNLNLSSSASYASNALDLSEAPRISAVSTATPMGSPSHGVSSSAITLIYYFTINDSEDGLVPIFVKALGKISTSPSAEDDASAYFSVSAYNTKYLTRSIDSNEDQSSDYSFSIKDYYELPTNTPISVELTAETTANADQDSVPASAFASVDPYFALDPSYKGLSLTFSPGINNVLVSTVPLPASAPLFGLSLIGLGVFGYGMKRRKEAAAA